MSRLVARHTDCADCRRAAHGVGQRNRFGARVEVVRQRAAHRRKANAVNSAAFQKIAHVRFGGNTRRARNSVVLGENRLHAYLRYYAQQKHGNKKAQANRVNGIYGVCKIFPHSCLLS